MVSQPILGGIHTSATVVVAVDVHPLAVSVMVTVYVFATKPVIVAVVPLLLHEKVNDPEPPEAIAVAVPSLVTQVSSVAFAVTEQGTHASTTVVVAVAVHPLAESVMVTVYVPAVKLLIVAVVPLLFQA